MKALLTKMCLGRYLQQKVDTYSKNQSTSFLISLSKPSYLILNLTDSKVPIYFFFAESV